MYPTVTGTIAEVFEKYDVGPVLPAEGYSQGQLEELEQAITATPCDAVVIATPMDLRHLIRLTKPAVCVTYELEEIGPSRLRDVLGSVIARADLVPTA
jgi:predicted GTPase